MTTKKKAVFFSKPDSEHIEGVFGQGRFEQYAEVLELPRLFVHRDNLKEHREYLKDVTVGVCTWGMPEFTAEEIREYLPSLELLLYVAGSVHYFAHPFLNSGIRITTAGAIMNEPVAEFTLAAILHANKGTLLSIDLYRQKGWQESHDIPLYKFPGTYRTKVGILGAGRIGALVIRMLKNHSVELLVFDPFLSEERAQEMGVKKAGLKEIFSTCQTISNHLADNPQTRGMLDYELFSLMGDTAAFVNTGRGAQVVEADLVRAMQEKPLRHAILDVTYPEPADPIMLCQPNIFCTPHIAGSAREESYRLADGVLDIYKEFLATGHLREEVTKDMLATMA